MLKILRLSAGFLFFGCISFFMAKPSWAVPSFTRETGPLLSSATPQAVITSTAAFRMYFIRDFSVRSATSTDGLIWSEEPGLRLSTSTEPLLSISSITGFTLLPLDAGGFRALYSAVDPYETYRIYSATSSDGMAWANDVSTAIPSISTSVFIGKPNLLEHTNGDWRVYFVANSSGLAAADRQIFTALSTNEGVDWATATVVFAQQAGDVCVSTLTSGSVRLLYTAPLTSETTNSRLLSGISSNNNGTTFSLESGARLSTGSSTGSLSYPLLFRSTESFRWRVYYAYTAEGSTTPHTFSALTLAPDPQSITPNTFNRTDVASVVTVLGEIFSPSPTVKITLAGQSDGNGTSVTRANDQTITATLDPAGKALGAWSVVVSNSDGQTGTLTGVFNITFSGGTIGLTDNLLRPRTGARTRIDVTIFDEGNITLELYTVEGQLIKTIMNETAAVGTTTVYWDGRTDDGNLVASGTYVLRAEGPKLESIKKIVVIK